MIAAETGGAGERNAFAIPEKHARGNLRVLRRAPESAQDPSASFDDIGWLRELSGLPVLVKGVLRANDALLCIDVRALARGADAVAELLGRLSEELSEALALAGCRSPADCNPSLLRG